MAASSGISGSPRPAVLGDALGTALLLIRMAIEMASESATLISYIFSYVDYLSCITVANDIRENCQKTLIKRNNSPVDPSSDDPY